MATSGTFTGSRGGGSTGPYLKLAWSRIDVDEANNKSQLRLTLSLVADYSLNFSASKSASLDGTGFTYTSGFSGTGTKTIKTLDKWFTHGSDGTLTVALDGVLNIAISWSGSTVNTLSVSGNATIDTIARASDFTAFSLSNSVLNTSTAVTVNYTLARKSTAFSQAMTLKYGSTVIKSWTTTGTGALTQALSATEVNNIIKAMSTVKSGTLTLTMQTKSGSTNIGSLLSRTTSMSLNAAIKPTATGLTVSIYGSGRDKTLAKYIQNISKVTASFTNTAGYGASIKSSTIVVKLQSDSSDSQTIASTSGTTAGVVKKSGTYSVTATVTDSRGLTATVSTTIAVVAYSPPSISKFNTARSSVLSTSVLGTITAAFSMGTSNPTNITVVGVNNKGVKATLYTLNATTTSPISLSQTYANQLDTSAYTYTLTITDSFGKIATSTSKVATAFVELTIAKGKGIGVGKVHEQGALDVGGDIYLSGQISLAPNKYLNANGTGGLHAHNADIVGLNNLVWNDALNSKNEGLQFPKTGTPADTIDYNLYDTFRIIDGVGYLNDIPIFTSLERILWTGGYYMTAAHTCTLTGDKALNKQPNGWILVWGDYGDGKTNDYNFVYSFVHKSHVDTWSGTGIYFVTPSSSDKSTTKYLYVSNDKMVGAAENEATTERKNVVLRKVIGW